MNDTPEHVTSHQPPPPVDLDTVGGVLRFGVGVPDGRRSSTWSVIANKTKRDVYFGPRRGLATFKLSLHESGVYRFAYTEEWAKAQRWPREQDRLIHKLSL